jgi:hypothetical protein
VTWSAANCFAADSSQSVAQSCSAYALSTVDCRLAVDNMSLVALDCDGMDGHYSASCTSVEAVADNGDVKMKLVAKAVRV